VKRIEVLPGKRLSLQSHNHRSEHWVVVQGVGTVEVQIGSDTNRWVKDLATWESTFVPQGTKHRLSNRTDQMLIIIEVQCGNYTGEDDITRYEDDFNRIQS
jgi:mannose-6-phosphate isomerase-like protein (cupin superfamily)